MWCLFGALWIWDIKPSSVWTDLCVQSIGSLYPNYFSLFPCSSAFALMPQKSFWHCSHLLSEYIAKPPVSGQKRRMLWSELYLLLPPGKRAVSQWVGWAGCRQLKEAREMKRDRQKKKYSLVWELGEVWGGVPKYQNMPMYETCKSPCMKMYFFSKNTIKAYLGGSFSLRVGWRTGTGCPRRLWMPHPWRHSRPGWMWLQFLAACSYWPRSFWSCLPSQSRKAKCQRFLTRGETDQTSFNYLNVICYLTIYNIPIIYNISLLFPSWANLLSVWSCYRDQTVFLT